MPNYKEMYFRMAARVADAIDILIEAQQQGEQSYIEDEPEITVAPFDKKEQQDDIPES